MPVSSEEWRECSDLVPSDEHLRLWVPEEAPNVGYQDRHPLLRDQSTNIEKSESECLPPEKVIPAIPSVKVILTPTSMCSHVPMLSPVQIAPYF